MITEVITRPPLSDKIRKRFDVELPAHNQFCRDLSEAANNVAFAYPASFRN
jgi:hypothetical protein